ncbi:MAG: HEPN domain-containing protein [Deltaproteobacteria bacterium]|nr:HEPN domain-containing protein [Deltaproteobacteria bacterium]
MEWTVFLAKAQSNLRVARLAFENKEYDPCVSRAYYAVFHAEIAALLHFTELRPRYWEHQPVQGEFNRRLIRERKVFSSDLANVHNSLVGRRHDADCRLYRTSGTVARRGLAKAEAFVQAVQTQLEEKS